MLARAMVERWEAPITPNGGTKSQTLKSVLKSRLSVWQPSLPLRAAHTATRVVCARTHTG